ncbi:MAG TPA: ABC transporter, partial [Methylococcaceae bacterium]|nr:ABC transporter [Methylococcaceae bacterium]
MTDILIDIQNKTHRGTLSPTIEDFSLTLHAGEFVCLVGPSGCGKTTLLNSIAGLDRDYVGNIHLSNTQNLPKIGYVFQRPCLLPWRTVSENIELVLTTHTAGQKAYVA